MQSVNPLTFEFLQQEDIPHLTEIMTRAFDDDSQKHLGVPKGGPPGYDNGDFLRRWGLHPDSDAYKISLAGKPIGSIIVWIRPDQKNVLGCIFVDPTYQDRGLGQAIWQYIEQKYASTEIWRLETPAFAMKNHHFYQKCGFEKTQEVDDSFVFEKTMPPTT